LKDLDTAIPPDREPTSKCVAQEAREEPILKLTLERARSITQRRNAAMMACDADAFLDLWADD